MNWWWLEGQEKRKEENLAQTETENNIISGITNNIFVLWSDKTEFPCDLEKSYP